MKATMSLLAGALLTLTCHNAIMMTKSCAPPPWFRPRPCTQEKSPPVATLEVSDAMPELVSNGDRSAPDWPNEFSAPLALFPDGRTALSVAASGSEPRLVVLDSNGREEARFARGGRGPGEIQVVAELLTSPGIIWAYDMNGLKLEALRPDGSRVRTVQFSGPIIPFRVDQDSADVLRFTSTGAMEIARLSLAKQDGRLLLSAARGEPGERILVMQKGVETPVPGPQLEHLPGPGSRWGTPMLTGSMSSMPDPVS